MNKGISARLIFQKLALRLCMRIWKSHTASHFIRYGALFGSLHKRFDVININEPSFSEEQLDAFQRYLESGVARRDYGRLGMSSDVLKP